MEKNTEYIKLALFFPLTNYDSTVFQFGKHTHDTDVHMMQHFSNDKTYLMNVHKVNHGKFIKNTDESMHEDGLCRAHFLNGHHRKTELLVNFGRITHLIENLFTIRFFLLEKKMDNLFSA